MISIQNLAKLQTFLTNWFFMTFSLRASTPQPVTAFKGIELYNHKQTVPTFPSRRSSCYKSKKRRPKRPTPTIKPYATNSLKSVLGTYHLVTQSILDHQHHQQNCPKTTGNLLLSSLITSLMYRIQDRTLLHRLRHCHRSLNPILRVL